MIRNVDNYRFGDNLYNAIKKRGLKHREVAEMIDVSEESISRWCNGGSLPYLGYIIKLKNALGCTLDELVEGVEKQ